MSPADEYEFKEFCRRFGNTPPPQVFGNPGHCSECADANRRLMSLDREHIDAELLREPARGWFLSWMGVDGFRFFLPGICHAVMEDPQSNLGLLLDRLNPDWLAQLATEQRQALHDLLCYCRDCGYASDDYLRRDLRAKLEATGAGSWGRREVSGSPVAAGPKSQSVSANYLR